MTERDESEFEFNEVVGREGTVIEVRERATGKLRTTIEPDLFAYMLGKAWEEADDTLEESDQCRPS